MDNIEDAYADMLKEWDYRGYVPMSDLPETKEHICAVKLTDYDPVRDGHIGSSYMTLKIKKEMTVGELRNWAHDLILSLQKIHPNEMKWELATDT